MARAGHVLPFAVMLALAGCGAGNFNASPAVTEPPASTPPLSTPPTSVFYVGNEGFNSAAGIAADQVLEFSRAANGNADPLLTLNLPPGFSLESLASDLAGQLYVSGTVSGGTGWEVLVYAAGASGSATPIHTLQASTASFRDALGLTVDSSGQLYISDSTGGGRVLVMAPGADGMAVPLRTIAGSATHLAVPDYAMSVDGAGNLYVANNAANGAVLVFGPAANGNVAPLRTVTDATVMKSGQVGLDVDSAGTLYVASILQVPGVTTFSTISVFAPGANGAVAPVRTIAVDGGNAHLFASSLRLDSATGTIFLAADDAKPVAFSYAATASGPATPMTRMTSSAWNGPGYLGIALH